MRTADSPGYICFECPKSFWVVEKHDTKEELIGLFLSLHLISFRLTQSTTRTFPFHCLGIRMGISRYYHYQSSEGTDSNHQLITLACLLDIIITMTVLSLSLFFSRPVFMKIVYCIPGASLLLCLLSIRRSLLAVFLSDMLWGIYLYIIKFMLYSWCQLVTPVGILLFKPW